MRILHTVQYYAPAVGGSEEVVRQLSERLAARGHEVTVATAVHPGRTARTINGVNIAEFRVSGNSVNGIRGDSHAYVDFVRTGRFDVMLNYAAQIWSSDLIFPHLAELPCAKVFVQCGYSALSDPAYVGYFREMPGVLARYDRAVYMSASYQDKRFGDDHGLTNAEIIPNGADEREFSTPNAGFRERYHIHTPYLLLCVANHYPSKGHRMVIDAFRRLKRRDCTLVIIGQPYDRGWRRGCYRSCQMAAWLNGHVRLFMDVPRADVVAAFCDADLFLFGSQIECAPLVIYEAMAAAVRSLLDHPAEREAIGRRARDAWGKHYTWRQITDQYEQLYRRLTEGKRV